MLLSALYFEGRLDFREQLKRRNERSLLGRILNIGKTRYGAGLGASNPYWPSASGYYNQANELQNDGPGSYWSGSLNANHQTSASQPPPTYHFPANYATAVIPTPPSRTTTTTTSTTSTTPTPVRAPTEVPVRVIKPSEQKTPTPTIVQKHPPGTPTITTTVPPSKQTFNPFKPLLPDGTTYREDIRLRYKHVAYLNASLVEMPFIGGVLSLVVLVPPLPSNRNGLSSMLTRLNGQVLMDSMQSLDIKRMDITVSYSNKIREKDLTLHLLPLLASLFVHIPTNGRFH